MKHRCTVRWVCGILWQSDNEIECFSVFCQPLANYLHPSETESGVTVQVKH